MATLFSKHAVAIMVQQLSSTDQTTLLWLMSAVSSWSPFHGPGFVRKRPEMGGLLVAVLGGGRRRVSLRVTCVRGPRERVGIDKKVRQDEAGGHGGVLSQVDAAADQFLH